MAKIMLVEDDNNLRQIYEDRLAAEGYEIVSAPDGEEALALAVKERPDLIIADVMMPKVSGFDMLDILRSTPETKDCKIIMMTALSQAEDKARAEKLGADRYLVKSQVTLEDVAKIAGEILNADSATPAETTPTGPTSAPAAPTAPAPTSASIPVSTPPEPTSAPAAPVVAPEPAAEPTPAPAQAVAVPAPEPVPAPAPAVAPVTPPTTTSIPITTPSDDDTNSSDDAAEKAALEATALAAANLAAPIGTEKTEANGKIDEFIASNPTLSGSAETPTTPETAKITPTPAATIEVKTEESEPEAATASTVEPTPAPEPTPPNVTIVTEPAPAPTTTAAADEASQKVADAVDGLLKETESTPTDTKDAAETEKPQGYVADGGNTESQSMIHTKRIEPISDGSIPTPPDINELLAREGEIGSAQPPISSVISPGNGGSVNAAPVDNTPQVNVLAEDKGNEPPAPAQPAMAPNSDITL